MANENGNSNPEIEAINLDEISDIDVLKEHYQKLDGTYRDVSDKNKQLFERTKKAEGFELKEGKWVKPAKVEPKVDANPLGEPSKPSELDKGDKALLVAYGIKGQDEFALAKNFMNRTGDDIDAIVGDDIFQAKLKALRDAKAVADATPKGNKRSANAPQDAFDVAYKKYVDEGTFPENTPDNRELREKLVEKRAASETSDSKFYNSPVPTKS